MKTRFKVVVVAVIIVASVFAAALYNVLDNIDKRTSDQAQILKKQTQILAGVRAAQRQADATQRALTAKNKRDTVALAAVVEGMAGGFGTPPSPNPSRDAAVKQLCDIAAKFRAAAGDLNPPPCPPKAAE